MKPNKFMGKAWLAGQQLRRVICLVFLVTLSSVGTGNCWWGSSYNYYWQPPSPIYAVATGQSHTVGLRQNGTVSMWGDNAYGQLNVPSGLTGVTAVFAGMFHSVALKNDGTVVAWGSNEYGQINVPANLTGVRTIAVGYTHTLALKYDGTVVAWGNNKSGQTSIPTTLNGVVSISAGANHSVTLMSDGTLLFWGVMVAPLPKPETLTFPSMGSLVN